MHRARPLALALLLAFATACSQDAEAPSTEASPELKAQQAELIGNLAYLFGYPMLEHYRTLLGVLQAKGTPLYVGSLNTLAHATRLLGPETTQIVRPNNDTLYSRAVLDLRAEPMVLTVPPVPNRYFSFQLIDLYTHNLGYIGTRTTGIAGGSYLIAGPGWTGETPPGIDALYRSETNLVVALGRTEVKGPDDVPAVEAIQAGYRLQPLSAFLGRPAPPAPPPYAFPAWSQEKADGAGFLDYLVFLLDQVAVHPSEAALVDQFRAVQAALDEPGIRAAVEAGMATARGRIDAELPKLGKRENGWSLIAGLFGDRPAMQERYLVRAAAAKLGLWGNDTAEAYYPSTTRDGSGAPLDGAKARYTLRFEASQLPDVDAFWSITMYDLPGQHMVANPIDRYSIGDRTPGLVYADDGSLTLVIQADPPGEAEQPNWLPAPRGPFSLTLRMYLPAPEALEGPYAPPPLQPAGG